MDHLTAFTQAGLTLDGQLDAIAQNRRLDDRERTRAIQRAQGQCFTALENAGIDLDAASLLGLLRAASAALGVLGDRAEGADHTTDLYAASGTAGEAANLVGEVVLTQADEPELPFWYGEFERGAA